MRVLVIANNFQQASYRLRIAALVPLMRDLGVEWDVRLRPRTCLAARRLLDSAADYDAVILQRKILSPGDAARLGRAARRLFFDVDDAVWTFPTRHSLLTQYKNRRRFLATLAAVDHVVGGSRLLCEHFAALGKPTSLVPTCVDTLAYPAPAPDPRPPRLLWIGSRSTLRYLAEILPAVRQGMAAHAGARIVVVADAFPPGDDVDAVPWSESAERAALAAADVGLAPLPDDEWTRGKCAFKIVQYQAASLPTIASPVGANADLVTPATGLLATTPAQWTAAVATLLADAAARHTLGFAAREQATARLDVRSAARAWQSILNTPAAT